MYKYKISKYFIHYNVTRKTISARNAQSHAVSSSSKVSDSQQENIFLRLSYLKKPPTRLTRKICEFQFLDLWGTYHYITAVL